MSGWKQRRQDPWGKPFPVALQHHCSRRLRCAPPISTAGSRSTVLTSFAPSGYTASCTGSPRCWLMPKASGRRASRQASPASLGTSVRVVATDQGFLDLLTVTFLTEYRQRPMHVLGVPEVVALATGGLIGLWLTAEKILTGASIGNRPLLLLAVLLVLVGVQFFGLGLLGELLVHGEHGHERLTQAARSRICGAGQGPHPENGSPPSVDR